MKPSKIQNYMRLAEEEATKAERIPFCDYAMGCVIIKKGVPIASGHNTPYNAKAFRLNRQHRKSLYSKFFSLHAEMQAIVSARQELRGAVVFVSGHTIKNGNLLTCSKPCKNCMVVLRQCGVSAVYYMANGEPEAHYFRGDNNGIAQAHLQT